MRPNQQSNKNRSRGRNNNGGRKHLNPLSRNYESNGPDVKVRGNAAHVAEKYLQLARDAQSSGDSVMAENYLQHAEHYFRILAAAQAAQNPQRDQFGQPQSDSYDDDDDFPPVNDRFASPEPPAPRFPQNQPSPQPPYEAGGSPPAIVAEPAEGGGETVEGAEPVAAEAGAEGQGADGEGTRRHRDRRGRRRRGALQGEGGDPAAAPQPDVGELPAFLTGTTAAE
jgi:hypothetical protein